MSVFGKAKYGNKSRNWFKLKDGDAVYRILPPMGDLQEDGRWSAFYSIHYGYKNSAGEMRTFQSTKVVNRKTKMVEVRDAALDRIDQLKAKLDEAKKAGKTDLVEQLLKLVGGKKSRYNLDNNHYVNAVDLQGNIGILKIRHRAKLALDAVIKRLRDSGIDPLDPETGRYFVFSRSGMGMDTTYQVSIYKKRLQVQGVGEVEQDVVHVIDEEFAKRCLVQNKDGSFTYKEAARLDTLFKKPTAEEVARIVAEGEKAVDEILDAKNSNGSGFVDHSEDTSGLEGEEELEEVSAPVAAAPQATTVTQEVVAAKVVPQATVRPPSPPKTSAQSVAEQSDEEFLKSLGLN